MLPMRHLLLLADANPEEKRGLGAVATAAGLDLVCVKDAAAALRWLDLHSPSVVVFDSSLGRADAVCAKVRSKPVLAGVPLIALGAELGDVAIEELYADGADDVIVSSARAGLMSRLRALKLDEQVAKAERGAAVVADRDRARADVYTRVLSNAGYEVKQAYDDVALRYYARRPETRLVAVSAELTELPALIQKFSDRGDPAVWVVLSPRRQLPAVHADLQGLPKVAVLGTHLPPSNLLFLSNELLSGGGAAKRATERVLYGTAVRFRGAGEDEDDHGFSYNLSAGGLFVRTLAPPEDEEVWLELRPPRQKRWVRLLGKVVWRCPFGFDSGATTPPGFGVKLMSGLGNDIRVWSNAYSHLVDTPRASTPGLVSLAAPLVGVGKTEDHVRLTTSEKIRVGQKNDEELQLDGAWSSDELEGAEAEAAPLVPPAKPSEPSVSASKAQFEDSKTKGAPLNARSASSGGASEALLEHELDDGGPESGTHAEAAPTTERGPRVTQGAEADRLVQHQGPADSTDSKGGRGAWLMGVLILVLLAGAGFLVMRQNVLSRPESPQQSEVREAPTQLEKPATLSSAPGVAPTPSTFTSAEVEAVDAAQLPKVALDDGRDGSRLNWSKGFLIVKSKVVADVYATGFKLGPTNTKNESPCGLKYVRLGRGEPPTWVSEGQTVDVKCRAVTEVRLAASEGSR